MKKTSNTSLLAKTLGLALCLGVLPLVVLQTGCAGDRYNQSTGEAVDDRAVSSRVKAALAHDPEYKFEGVEVRTFKGVTQLSGFVNTSSQKSRAASIARDVEGIKDVENNITVKE